MSGAGGKFARKIEKEMATASAGALAATSLPLHRVRLPQKVQAMLNARGIQTAAQLLVMTEVELREKLDVSVRARGAAGSIVHHVIPSATSRETYETALMERALFVSSLSFFH